MVAKDSVKPLIVIVGPTASGKTALAIDLAKQFDGEIVCADSRTVYKGMDIGTAKPTKEERTAIPHYLLDIVRPDEPFSAADFQQLAKEAIKNIRGRGKIPFLVGGTGLYVDSIIFDYRFGPAGNPERRRLLEGWSIDQLQKYCIENNIKIPENSRNKRYLVRAIEQEGVNNLKRDEPIENCFVVGISTEKSELERRITLRAEQIFQQGVLEEARQLSAIYGWNSEAMTGNIYRLAQAVFRNELSIEEAKKKFITLDRRLAKRQMTWFKRNPFIQWGNRFEVEQLVKDYLG